MVLVPSRSKSWNVRTMSVNLSNNQGSSNNRPGELSVL